MHIKENIKPGEFGDDDLGFIICTCDKCKNEQLLFHDDCEEETDSYVKLKDGVELICEVCGNKSEQIISFQTNEEANSHPTPQYVPKCPICHSPNIHKITTGTKVARAAMFGIFALPKAGKQWKCDNCGSEF